MQLSATKVFVCAGLSRGATSTCIVALCHTAKSSLADPAASLSSLTDPPASLSPLAEPPASLSPLADPSGGSRGDPGVRANPPLNPC